MDNRELLGKQMGFIMEIDKIKSVFRKSRLFDGSRYENDAEHSWHLAVMAAVLAGYSAKPIDIAKVIKMVIIHDIPEAYTGDVIVYAKTGPAPSDEDMLAAKKIFGLLPDGQGEEFYGLWLEFEKKETAEAKFAGALDRLEPLMQNYYNNGSTWKENNISADMVREINSRINDGAPELWDYAAFLIDDSVKKGFIA
ncbi:MAG: HD domain-containing protein [Spirochaetia bacterium]|nr:HD domain-containing protein [Spirochaetia bacterium]